MAIAALSVVEGCAPATATTTAGATATAPATTASATTAQQTPALGAAQDAATIVTLRIGESIAHPETKTVVTMTDVSDDSRCPTDATCIWAGDATVTLRVQPSTGDAATIALRINQPESRSAAAGGIRVTLERLEPAPQAGRAIERGAYLASLALSQP